MADMQEAMSKSAKRRAAKKARDAAGEEEEKAPAPAPTPTEAPKSAAKAKAKAATPAPAPAPAPAPKAAEPKGKAKAKAEPKAEPKKEPEPKAKAKAKADAKAAVVEQPKAKEQPKAATKAKAKAKQPAEPPKPKEPEVPAYVEFDDGKGGEWEQASGKTKKQEKQEQNRKKKEEEEAKKKLEEEEAAKKKEEEEKKAKIAAEKEAKQKLKQAAKAAAAPKAKAEELKPGAAPDTDKTPATTAPTTAEPKEPEGPADVVVTVKIPDSKLIGRVIGPKGANIQKIQEATKITKIDTSGDTVTIIGPPAAVPLAEAAVKELIENGFMRLSYTDFAEGGVQVHPQYFPDIIGQRGAVINDIKKETKVEIKIPEVPKGGKDGFGKGGAGSESAKKYKIEIVGDKDNVEKAKEIINSIVMYGHHEVTHPDTTHEEIEIPSDCYGYIIGRGGSELRHIQNNYQVKVNIPREHSVNEKTVVIGLASDVPRAVAYINKQLQDEETKAKEREEKKAKGETEKAPRKDPEDDDGPVEPWMNAYIKKR